MAYVVARPKGRFEIRESIHTPRGPRARSLANFGRLTDAVLAKAGQRATRPFDAAAVRSAAERATAGATATRPATSDPAMRRFVESSRRMATATATEPRPSAGRPDPGDALIDLLGFVAQVTAFQPSRSAEPLRFPPLARLAAGRTPAAGPR